jgi:hypothetical protein
MKKPPSERGLPDKLPYNPMLAPPILAAKKADIPSINGLSPSNPE